MQTPSPSPSPSPSPLSARGSNELEHAGHGPNSAKVGPKSHVAFSPLSVSLVAQTAHGYHVQSSGFWPAQQATLKSSEQGLRILELGHTAHVTHDSVSSFEGLRSGTPELVLTKVDHPNDPEHISACQGQNARDQHVSLDFQGSSNDNIHFGNVWDQNPTVVSFGPKDFTHSRNQHGVFNHAPDAGRVNPSGRLQSTEFGQAGTQQGAIGTSDNPFEESSSANKADAGVSGFNGFSMHSIAGNFPQTETDSFNISINDPSASCMAQEEMATFGNPYIYSHDATFLDNALDNDFAIPMMCTWEETCRVLLTRFNNRLVLSTLMPQPAQLATMGKPRTGCTWYGCNESFARHTDLDRHVQAVHYGIKHHCTWLGCGNNRGKGYCRLEKLRTHRKEKHGYALV
ncbi:hypothetical protein B0J14DRAFT_703717 [Halenospora varia]|nr:hypothetical protein B0J14DRAFT_703717 [Halenospora varia]